jgi:hypothetical protein
MQSNTAVKFAPVFSDEKRVDLAIEAGEAVLQLSTWTEGLGWCTQKTMRLDAELLDEVHRVITAVRLKMKRTSADSGVEHESARVLEFPKFI